MTNKEATNFLSQVKSILLNNNSWLESTKTPIKESFDMAISALEKQIPKKPKMPLDAYWVCPTCGKKVEHPYECCMGCGQAIDWEEDEG